MAVSDSLELRSAGPICVAGFVTRASNEDPSGIGALWQTFHDRSGEIGVAAAPLGVYHDYESDHTGGYSLLVGLPVVSPDELPDGWHAVSIPRADYMVFPVEHGPIPQVIVQAWQRVWEYFAGESREYDRTYAVDFEQYAPAMEILIAVRRRGA